MALISIFYLNIPNIRGLSTVCGGQNSLYVSGIENPGLIEGICLFQAREDVTTHIASLGMRIENYC